MKLWEFDAEQQAAWETWVLERPPLVADLARRFPPNVLFWLDPPGQRVTIVSYNEGGTLTVNVTGQFNLVTFDRQVFGIKPEDLTECDLPDEEPVGTLFTESAEIDAFIDVERGRMIGESLEALCAALR